MCYDVNVSIINFNHFIFIIKCITFTLLFIYFIIILTSNLLSITSQFFMFIINFNFIICYLNFITFIISILINIFSFMTSFSFTIIFHQNISKNTQYIGVSRLYTGLCFFPPNPFFEGKKQRIDEFKNKNTNLNECIECNVISQPQPVKYPMKTCDQSLTQKTRQT